MSAEDAVERAELEVTIYDYVYENVAKFISGDRDLDADWDTFQSQLKKMGLPRYLELMQKGYENQWK